jgi:hypothetical protein
MPKINNNLKKLLINQAILSEPLSDKIIKSLETPRYSSGKLMRYGDIPLHFLELETTCDNNTNDKINLIVLEESEIDFYCKKYKHIESKGEIIYARKK